MFSWTLLLIILQYCILRFCDAAFYLSCDSPTTPSNELCWWTCLSWIDHPYFANPCWKTCFIFSLSWLPWVWFKCVCQLWAHLYEYWGAFAFGYDLIIFSVACLNNDCCVSAKVCHMDICSRLWFTTLEIESCSLAHRLMNCCERCCFEWNSSELSVTFVSYCTLDEECQGFVAFAVAADFLDVY